MGLAKKYFRSKSSLLFALRFAFDNDEDVVALWDPCEEDTRLRFLEKVLDMFMLRVICCMNKSHSILLSTSVRCNVDCMPFSPSAHEDEMYRSVSL